ncbi:MAG TPA: Tat pathway signal protein, partial [Bacteroidales bacterium]|nr:Tat pathway signal protein [Bacteroidales bacterium]
MKKTIGVLIMFTLLLSCSNNAKQHEFSLDELQKRTFRYFWETADPVTNLIPDRWPTTSFSSIAAQGFGYAAWIIGIENGWVTREEVALRVKNSLKFLYQLPQESQAANIAGYKGFFYHFLDMKTGYRFKQVELSSIDTGLLMAGILTCMS